MLVRNKLLKWADEPTIERILYIDPTRNDVVTIEVNYHLALPIWRKFEELRTAIDTNFLLVLDVDEFSPPIFSESELTKDKFKIYKQKRDLRYEVIEPFTYGEDAVRMFYRQERASLIAKRAPK